MKKDPNNSMNGTATMPSYFPCIKSSESHPLADWLYLKSVITSSPELRMMTETYRKRLAISKQFADQYKPEMPAITVSALMNGYGRQLADFLKPTYMFQLDFDHVKKEDMEQLIQLVRGDSHTMVEYVTVSGRGFRVFCAYHPVDDDDISVLELFDAVLQKTMAYYTQLLGIAPDKQCVDITRCAGLAYDPDAYFRWDAEPFVLGPKDLNPLYTKKALQAKYSARRNAKGGKRSSKVKEEAKSSDKGAPTIEEAASHIKELLDLWGYRFEPEHHNEYVWHFADICIYYGIPQEEVLTYADREFGTSYEDTASVIKSRYKHLNKFGIWHFYRHGEGRSAKPSVRGIKQWLLTHYLFRRNVLTGFYEVESRFVLDGKYPDWVRIDDNIENSIWSEMDESGLHLSEKTLHNIINSDFSEPFDPLDDYLRSLPKWKKGEDPDYIDQLADRIEVENLPDNEHTQSLFRYL
ncbi:BT4734/BF3469 family protein [Segatella copri]|uniref:BT4734/BF3469 family protein n=1 Tax=Segatella copri TaxID=165179 RepID=UPI00294AEEC7|nr:BT4734/BF3469 family protein [Segatella copri]